MPAGSANGFYKHGHRRGVAQTSPTWISWRAMIARCYNTGAADYPRYGGAGITVCDRWRDSYAAFLADVGLRPDGKTLDRIAVTGNYEPGNVRWATTKEQGRNRKKHKLLTHNGRTQCMAAWAEEMGMPAKTLATRLRKGWSVEDALTRPRMSRAERGMLALEVRGVISRRPGGVDVAGCAERAARAKGRAARRRREEERLGLIPLF